MTTIKKVTKITGWNVREDVQELGDLTGMKAEPPINTILSGRPATIHAWFNQETGDGYEQRDITLHPFEV